MQDDNVKVKVVKRAISIALEHVTQAGFAYLTPAIREAIFAQSDKLDWNTIADTYLRENPEFCINQVDD